MTKILPAPVAILNKIQHLVLRNNASVIDSVTTVSLNSTRTNQFGNKKKRKKKKRKMLEVKLRKLDKLKKMLRELD